MLNRRLLAYNSFIIALIVMSHLTTSFRLATRGIVSFIPSLRPSLSLSLSLSHRRLFSTVATSSSSASFSSFSLPDTIFAVSSGQSSSVSGVAVVRVSGPAAWTVLQTLCNNNSTSTSISSGSGSVVRPREASLKSLYCPASKQKLDKALVLWFPGPHSFTGEDVVELHVHGSRAVIAGLFAAFEHMDVNVPNVSIRPAERGEFTKRAFDNGKMDLTEVEGLADLLAADTSQQRNQALRQMDGQLRKTYERWRGELMKCLAHTEAVIDFGDDDREGDINDSAMSPLVPIIQRLHDELLFHLKDGRKGEILREGIQIALVGQPNAGKSSLLNALARRPAAIVSPIAGTTRDIVEVRMDIGGVSCILRDTAGLRKDSQDQIEQEGMSRAREAFKQAHIRIFVVDISSAHAVQEAAELFEDVQNNIVPASDEDFPSTKSIVMTAFNKADLVEVDGKYETTRTHWGDLIGADPLLISCVNGFGLDNLEKRIHESIDTLLGGTATGSDAESVMITRERHRRHVRQCVEHLRSFLDHELPMDLAAEEIRLAMQELGKVTGRVDVEELLDIIFRDFCIGK